MRVAGIDGTKAGWVVVAQDEHGLSAFAAESISDAFLRLADAAFVAIDMPIGFLDAAAKGGRVCEQLARAAMPGRASCVFSSPTRAALSAGDYPEASAINRLSSPAGLGLSKQSFALFAKMREVDDFLTPERQKVLFEVHPELSFTRLAEAAGVMGRLATKHEFDGLSSRVDLLARVGMDPRGLLKARATLKAKSDDILDATVACWTASRRAAGMAMRYPAAPARDSRGLFMEMWA